MSQIMRLVRILTTSLGIWVILKRILNSLFKYAGINHITHLKIDDNSLVLMELPEDITHAQMDSFRKGLREMLGKNANRVIMHTGKIKITSMQLDEVLTKIAEKKILVDE